MDNQINQEELLPRVSVNAQYMKDLSFENPSAPNNFANRSTPKIDLSLDLNIVRLEEENTFEVTIHIEAKAQNESLILFVVDLQYAGIFTLFNIPDDQQKLLLAIHCPSILFPFARKIIADVTHEGGFQPLMIDPIDFGALFHKKMLEENSQVGND